MVSETEFLKAYDDLADAIFRHCFFRVYDRETARDLTQETFVKTWEYIQKKENKIENLKAFLYRVATNMIIDHARAKKSTSLEELQETIGFDISIDSREQMADRIDLTIVTGYLKNIDEKYREAIVLRFVNDLTPQEISEVTGESANNVSVRIHRGLEQLKLIASKKQHARE